jgi:hypothetical protein
VQRQQLDALVSAGGALPPSLESPQSAAALAASLPGTTTTSSSSKRVPFTPRIGIRTERQIRASGAYEPERWRPGRPAASRAAATAELQRWMAAGGRAAALAEERAAVAEERAAATAAAAQAARPAPDEFDEGGPCARLPAGWLAVVLTPLSSAAPAPPGPSKQQSKSSNGRD